MDETGTYVVQSVRRVPEKQRFDNRLLQNVCGTPWEPNPGDVSTDLLEPMLIIPQLPDVQPTPTRVYNSDNRDTRNVYIGKADLEKCGYTQVVVLAKFTARDTRCLGKNTLQNAGDDPQTQWLKTRPQQLESKLRA